MEEKRLTRKQAIIRRRIFLGAVAVCLALVIALVVFIICSVFGGDDGDKTTDSKESSTISAISGTSGTSWENKTSSEAESSSKADTSSDVSSTVSTNINNVKLDANFGMLLLVNGDNPLPDDYDSNVRKDLVEIDAKYRNNNYVTKIHKDVYPYITAMVAAAQKDGVNLKVWSPFRSYADQKVLFQNQVNRVGGDEEKAATVVARPGTSEHNTGLCADFNMASDAFEDTEMYKWMVENAEDYGFIMRYREDKQPITGVIHESWHWRFVGINHAKQMNKLDMCLEEYVEYLEKNNSN